MSNGKRTRPKQLHFVNVDVSNRKMSTDNYRVDTSFQFAIWPVLALAQCFAMMPVTGVRCKDLEYERACERLTIRWWSFRVIGTLVYVVLGSVLLWMYTDRMSDTGVTAKNIGGAIFIVCSLLCTLLFVRLAFKWKVLMVQWARTEKCFLVAPYQRTGMLLSTRIRLTATCFLVLSFVDYLFFSVQTVYNYSMKNKDCRWSDENHFGRFFEMENRYIFDKIPFSVPVAIVKTITDIINTISSTYGNVFIILVSIGLSTRFKQLNYRLESLKGTNITRTTWYEIRSHYVSLCELLDSVDTALAPLILLSCATNLFFICFQLLNIFEKLPHLVNYIYFWFSLVNLIARTIGVFLSASAIHDASRKPAEFIKSIATAEWTDEVDRFTDQINGDTVALSGMKFFHMTRKVLLTLLGTILTYELVMLQFAESTKETDDKIESAESGC